MKIIDKYLLKHFIRSFLFCLLTFILLYVVIDLFDKLNEMIESKVELWVIFPYYLNSIPLIVVQTAPIAVLVAAMFSLGTFNRYNEITAMRSSGISLFRILTPLIAAGFIISIVTFIINDKVVPDSIMNSVRIKEEKIKKASVKKKTKKGEKILENIVFYGEGNKLIYARRYSVYKKNISGLIMHQQDENHNIVSKTTATEVQWKDSKWHGNNIMFFHLDNTGRIIGEPMFYEARYVDIKETPVDFEKRRHKAAFMGFEFMSFTELKSYIDRLSFESGPAMRNLKVALNQKISFPFVNLIVILIASPFALIHARRGGILMGIGISIALVLGYYTVMSFSLALGKAGFIHPVIAAWFANVSFAALGVILILRHR